MNKRINLYITKKQLLALRSVADDGLSVSEHIRRAIDLYIKSLREELADDE